jgi:transposase InsO family protein
MKKQHEPAYPARVRSKWYFLLEKAGWSAKRICEEYAISKKTLYKWRRLDRASRAHAPKRAQPALKLTPAVTAFLEEEKKRANPGPLKLSLMVKRRFGLKVSSTIVYRYMVRKGLVRKPQKKLPWYTPLKEPLVPKYPGDVVQMDAKHLWQEGRRTYQRTFVDVYTGMERALVTETMEAADTVRAFEYVQARFPFPIHGIQTDNGSENRGAFHQYLAELGVAHYFIPKRSPQWNGAVERTHRSNDEEYHLNPYRSWTTFDEYQDWFNNERLHLGKYTRGLTPMEKYREWAVSSP